MSTPSNDQRTTELLNKMAATKAQWDAEALASPDGPDATDALLSRAIETALAQGKGWKAGEKEAYMAKYFEDEDYLDPIFATTQEELEKTGMKDAFVSAEWDEPPSVAMGGCKAKGNEAFVNGTKNKAKNVQYFRDAVNHYYEAFMWAERVQPNETDNNEQEQSTTTTTTTTSATAADADAATTENPSSTDDDIPSFTLDELNLFKSTVLTNAALSHTKLKNWGHCITDATRALTYDQSNLKATYRLAVAHRYLKNWEQAGDAIDAGLALDPTHKELHKLQDEIEDRVNKSRRERQKREKVRAMRVSEVKEVWRYCRKNGIRLGRVPLVASVTEDEENGDDGAVDEARWHHHHPHTGCLPSTSNDGGGSSTRVWPCMFVYPSHNQSDFIRRFAETDMLALQMAEIFPEVEEEGEGKTTAMPWDYNHEFVCSGLAVYFEVHCTEENGQVVHPECVEELKEMGDAMKFYESSRALKGDEGDDVAEVARCVERRRLHRQRKAWTKKHGSLWSKPDPCPVVRVHPAATLRSVLTDKRMVVPNFMVTFLLFPEEHPAHAEFLKERKCLGLLEPPEER